MNDRSLPSMSEEYEFEGELGLLAVQQWLTRGKEAHASL